MSELFVVKLEDNKVLTHDGEFQLGIFHMSLEEFLSKAKSDFQETYWIPDSVKKRYKRINYQKHLKVASIGTKND
jgi:hypothetical protein